MNKKETNKSCKSVEPMITKVVSELESEPFLHNNESENVEL